MCAWLTVSSQLTAVRSTAAWRSSTAVAGERFAPMPFSSDSSVESLSAQALLMWRAVNWDIDKVSRFRDWCGFSPEVGDGTGQC